MSDNFFAHATVGLQFEAPTLIKLTGKRLPALIIVELFVPWSVVPLSKGFYSTSGRCHSARLSTSPQTSSRRRQTRSAPNRAFHPKRSIKTLEANHIWRIWHKTYCNNLHRNLRKVTETPWASPRAAVSAAPTSIIPALISCHQQHTKVCLRRPDSVLM